MINQIVTFRVKPEYEAMFKAALQEDKKNARQEQGCLEISLFSSRQNPCLIFSLERWKDQDAMDFHREHPYTVKICSLVDKALAAPVEVMDLKKIKPENMEQEKEQL